MYIKLAFKNVRQSSRDYFIYFMTLTVSVYLLYTFNSLDGWRSVLDLQEIQLALFEETAKILQYFSMFTIVIFAFLILYANRYLIRRRKQEFGIYRTLGMGNAQVARVLIYETMIAGVSSLVIGMLAGIVLSPLFGLMTSVIFNADYHFSIIVFPYAVVATLICFAVIFLVVMVCNVRMLRRQKDIDLIHGNKKKEILRVQGKFSSVIFFAVSVILLSVVYYVSVSGEEMFVVFLLPLGVAACLGTLFFFRFVAGTILSLARANKRFYYKKLHLFVLRQIDDRINSNYRAVSAVCVLLTISICMFSMAVGAASGMTEEVTSQEIGAVPIYIGMYFGIVFIVAGAAILSLQQLSQAVDSRRSYQIIDQIGTSYQMERGSVSAQNLIYFGLPLLLAAVHSIFGIRIISSLLGRLIGTSVAAWTVTPVVILVIYGIYFAVTNFGCKRILLRRPAEKSAA